MAKVDKHFLTGSSSSKYDFLEKEVNINNQIGYMLNRSLSMFHYTNLPDTIPVKELELLLQMKMKQHTEFQLIVLLLQILELALETETLIYMLIMKNVMIIIQQPKIFMMLTMIILQMSKLERQHAA